MHKDPDFDWLSAHMPQKNSLPARQNLATKVAGEVAGRV